MKQVTVKQFQFCEQNRVQRPVRDKTFVFGIKGVTLFKILN